MPDSQQPERGQDLMFQQITSYRLANVIDVGAGPGKWGRLLRGLVHTLDAIEIWAPYIEEYQLEAIYDHVIHIDARKFRAWGAYNVGVLGDIVEHMPKEDSREMVAHMLASGLKLYLSIPVTDCPQKGEPFGNPYEEHVAQWSHEELIADGWVELDRGLVPSGLATVGTYWNAPS